jgi:hypothetical protein
MKSGSTWYSTGSSWPYLPNGRKKSGWLYQFPGELAVHPGVGATQLTISKSLRNPPSSCAARHPPAYEQLEYWRPWNIVWRHIDPILFGQLRLPAVEKAHNNGCWPCATYLVKNYHTVRKVDFNRWTSENPKVIAPIEAPLKSADCRSKFVIFHTCTTFFFEIFLLRTVDLSVLVHFHPTGIW